MSKNTIIFCYSKSGNTRSFIEQVLSKFTNIEKVDTPSNITDVSQYDFVGFSSGIYYGKQAKEITQQIEKLNLTGKKCFFYGLLEVVEKNIIIVLKKLLKKKVEFI